MAKSIKIDDDVREILSAAEITETSLKLVGQLDRATYTKVAKVLDAAGGKWNRKSQTHIFASDPREILGIAISEGAIPHQKNILQAFYTPDAVADLVAQKLVKHDGLGLAFPRILEPSVGQGSLIKALMRADLEIETDDMVLIDIDANACRTVGELWPDATVVHGSFLDLNPESTFPAAGEVGKFDVIVMNPPFSEGQDIAHVTHALQFVREFGILVAIMSPTWLSSDRKNCKEFRKLLESYDDVVIDEIPEGAFKESGTNVRTVMVTVRP